MVKEAKRAVAAVRKAGVEVIEVPNEEFSRIGGALHCRTLRVLRDPGPLKNA
jgi:N-dimethylarginine dimethylaminohydrolase